MYLRVKAHIAPELSIQASGRDAQICRNLENHLVLDTYREVLQAAGKIVQPLALRIDNDVPIGKGCGSSAAARLAGIALAVHFGKLQWSDLRIVTEASRREHHPDNAAACWMGGIAVAGAFANGETTMASIRPKGKWPLLLAVPSAALSTEKARSVLPTEYSRADAVANIQNSMLLVTAFTQGCPKLLSAALHDRMHEPYRSSLCPLLPVLQQIKSPGILGVTLSGAGPSVLIFLDPQSKVKKVIRDLAKSLQLTGLSAELLPATITLHGARESWGG